MIEQLKTWVVNIATLVTLIVLLEMIIPSGKIKKFVNLVSGFILIIAIIHPVLGMLRKGIDLPDMQLTSSNFIDRKEIEQSSRIFKDKQMKQLVEAYRSKIIKQLEDGARQVPGVTNVQADVIFNEDYNSDSFGEVTRVFLKVVVEDKNTLTKPAIKVEKVDINTRDQPKGEGKTIDSKIKGELENKVSKMLDVQKENIVVTAAELQ